MTHHFVMLGKGTYPRLSCSAMYIVLSPACGKCLTPKGFDFMIARMGMRVSARIALAIFVLLGVLTAIAHADKARPACWFAREQNTNAPRIAVPTDVRS